MKKEAILEKEKTNIDPMVTEVWSLSWVSKPQFCNKWVSSPTLLTYNLEIPKENPQSLEISINLVTIVQMIHSCSKELYID